MHQDAFLSYGLNAAQIITVADMVVYSHLFHHVRAYPNRSICYALAVWRVRTDSG